MIKLLHWCALRMSGFAIWLHDKGGNLECWCDERMYKKQWLEWDNNGLTPAKAWLAVPTPETLGLYGEWGETDGE